MKTMRIRTLLTAFICIMLTAFLLTGCGDNKPSATAAATPTPTNQGSSTDDELQYLKAGDKYTYYAWYVNEGAELFGSDNLDTHRKEVKSMLESTYGITYAYIPLQSDGFAGVFASAMAGKPIADVAHAGMPGGTMEAYYYEGQPGAILVNIAETNIDFNDNQYFDVEAQKTYGTFNNGLYCFINAQYGFMAEQQIAYVNKSLLSDAGHSFEEIYNLVKAGDWTWDKFQEYVVNCSDPDNGIYGISRNMTVRGLTHSNNAKIIDTSERDGVLTDSFAGTAVNAIEAYDFYARLYNTGCVQPTSDSSGAIANFGNGKSVFMFNYANKTGDLKSMESTVDYGLCPIPKGPKADDYISEMSWFQAFCAYKGHENPNGVLKATKEIFKPMYARDSEEAKAQGEANLIEIATDPMSLEMLQMLSEKVVYTKTDLYYAAYIGYCDGPNEVNILTGEATAQNKMSSIEGQMNAVIDSLHNK